MLVLGTGAVSLTHTVLRGVNLCCCQRDRQTDRHWPEGCGTVSLQGDVALRRLVLLLSDHCTCRAAWDMDRYTWSAPWCGTVREREKVGHPVCSSTWVRRHERQQCGQAQFQFDRHPQQPKIHTTVVTELAHSLLTGAYVPCPGGRRHPRPETVLLRQTRAPTHTFTR